MSLRYVFDEHLRGVLPETVRRRAQREGYSLDVAEVGDESGPPLGILDPDLLIWAEGNQRILVSRDTNTLRGHLKEHLKGGRHSPGVFIVREPLNLALADWLVLMAFASSPDEWRDGLAFVP